MNTPTDMLRAGCVILNGLLVPNGFRFELRDAGPSSGGHFAWGEYVRGERRLALHFRWSLGVVTYGVGDLQASHESFVRAVLGQSAQNAYPGFSDAPLDGFRHLRADLEQFGTVFLSGSEEELRSLLARAASQEQRRPKGLKALFDSDSS